MQEGEELRVALVLVSQQIELRLRIVAFRVGSNHHLREVLRDETTAQHRVRLQTAIQLVHRAQPVAHHHSNNGYEFLQLLIVATTQFGIHLKS